MPASTGSPVTYGKSSSTRWFGSVTKVGATELGAAEQVFVVESLMETGASWTPEWACEITVTLPVPWGTLKKIVVPPPRLQNVWAAWASAEVVEGRTQVVDPGSNVATGAEVNVGVCGSPQVGLNGKGPASRWSATQLLVIDMVPAKAGPPSATQAPPVVAGGPLFPQPSRVNQAQAHTTAIVLCMSGGSFPARIAARAPEHERLCTHMPEIRPLRRKGPPCYLREGDGRSRPRRRRRTKPEEGPRGHAAARGV